MIPAGGSITFDDISEKTGLAKYAVRRLVRHVVIMCIFEEREHKVITPSSNLFKIACCSFLDYTSQMLCRYFIHSRRLSETSLIISRLCFTTCQSPPSARQATTGTTF